MASFVRDKGHVDRYRGLKVNYIDHHNPDLVIFDADNEEVQRIDLTRIRTLSNIHKVCKLLGMKELCSDSNRECKTWASHGQCEANPGFMLESCRLSCRQCGDNAEIDNGVQCRNSATDSDCEYWSTMGECDANREFMHTNCQRSCGVCTVENPSDGEEDDEFKDEL